MSYTDLRDFSCEFTGPVGDVWVQVEKLGGGTVGKAYDGKWRYIVTRNGEEIERGQDFESGTPMTHERAKYVIGSQFSDEYFDDLEHSDYPHEPGRLHDCPACQERCHCGEEHDESCDHPKDDGKLYHTTQCVWDGHESESGCEGHYDDDSTLTSGVGIGEPTYCDGSCR